MTDPGDMELRCTCRVRPLLGIARVAEGGGRFLHIKVYKRSELYAEIIVEEGPVRLRCRSCLRWFTVRIRKGSIELPERNGPSLVASRGR